MDIKLSIIIPTYNEEGNIGRLLTLTHEILQSESISHELIVVDDGSKDKTREIIRTLQKTISEIILIERDNERGLATALIRGYNQARGLYLGSMDADFAHDPKYIPAMIRILDNEKVDFIIGSRYVQGARFEGKPLLNKLASLTGQWLIKILLGLKIKDTSNNYRVFRKELWAKIKDKLHPDGNIMITEIAYLAEKNNFKFKEIPILYIERRLGKSKLSVFKETVKFFKNIRRIKNSR
ncbi:MAG: glycosyltransferase [bacterium]|nr:glycosyltransferase [bacterium]